jgi:hypothetical protein
MGTDLDYSNFGWFIDDVRIYTCIGAAAVPVLGTPANSSLTTNFKPKLDWYNTDNADHYELEVATDAAFTNLIFSKQEVSVSEYIFTTALHANTRYYWRVRAVNQINAPSAWSTAWYFRTALTPPAIEAPANGSTPDSLRPSFNWTASPGADSYSLVISTFSNFSTPLVDVTGTSTAYTLIADLPANVPFYWRVRANGTNTSAWTSASFTSPNPPTKPVLSAPANNANVFTYTPTLKWNAATIPVEAPALSHYHLQFDNDADFSSPLYDLPDLTERSFTIPDELAANQKFYWRVKAANILGQYSAWATRSIRTAIVAPVLLSPTGEFFVDGLRPTFEWSSSPDAASYTLVVSTLPDYTSPLINITQAATSYAQMTDLPVGVKLYWRVCANGANPSAWTSSSFMIPVPPAKPALSSPASAAKIYTYTPLLKWKSSVIPEGAPALAYYQLQVDNDADYSSLLYDQTELLATSFTIPEALTPNQKFYWRVRAVNILGQYSSWSARTFSTTIIPPVIQSPVEEFVTDGLRPRFEWSSSPAATGYTLILSTLPDFTTPLINITQSATSYTPIVDLPTGAKLYWRVCANGANPSAWTSASFMIPVPPAKPALSAPASSALVPHDVIVLKWKASVIAVGAPALAFYQVQFDDTADYSSPLYQADLTERTFSIPDALPTNQKFYWRVRAVNILGQYSTWSSRTLRTRILSPVINVPESGSLQDSLRPTFGWSSSPYAVSYTITVSSFADYSSALVNFTTSATTYVPTVNLPPGTLIYWRVMANGTHPSLWSTATFTTPNPPLSPALSSPADTGRVNSYTPTLKWNASVVPLGAPALANYHIQVDNDADFSSPLYDQSTLLNRVFAIPNPLADNQKYYWRVRAINTEGHYAAWSMRSFKTRIFAPIIEGPAPAPSTTESLRPILRWSTSPYAESYTLVVSSFADFSSPLVSATITDTSYVPSLNLPAASLVYWRVMANGKNPSLWTSSSFNTPNPPARPSLSSPSNTALISGYTPTLKWNPAVVPVGAPSLAYYHIQVDDQEDFSSPLYDQSVSLATEFPIVDPLPENMKYYWRVRAVNSEEQFSWWSIRSFRTRIYPLTIETPAAGTISESLRPTFRWSSSSHASGYTLVVSTLADFSSPLINVTVTDNSYLPAIDLPSATVIYWRVMAQGSNPSIWSAASFTTPNPPLRAVLQSPIGNVITYTVQPTLTWKPVSTLLPMHLLLHPTTCSSIMTRIIPRQSTM